MDPNADDCEDDPKVEEVPDFDRPPKAEVMGGVLLEAGIEPKTDVLVPNPLRDCVDGKEESGWFKEDEVELAALCEVGGNPKADVAFGPFIGASAEAAGADCCGWLLNVVDLLAKGLGLGRDAC